jgi:hypothetical protein
MPLSLTGIGPAAVGYYKDGDKRWRRSPFVAGRRRRERDVPCLQAQAGGLPVKGLGDEAVQVVLQEAPIARRPSTSSLAKGRRRAVGDEELVLDPRTRRKAGVLKLTKDEKIQKLAAWLAGHPRLSKASRRPHLRGSKLKSASEDERRMEQKDGKTGRFGNGILKLEAVVGELDAGVSSARVGPRGESRDAKRVGHRVVVAAGVREIGVCRAVVADDACHEHFAHPLTDERRHAHEQMLASASRTNAIWPSPGTAYSLRARPSTEVAWSRPFIGPNAGG